MLHDTDEIWKTRNEAVAEYLIECPVPLPYLVQIEDRHELEIGHVVADPMSLQICAILFSDWNCRYCQPVFHNI
jgi:hypothetical protein